MNSIPPITDPMGKYWEQPPVENILIDDSHAVMNRCCFDKLIEYSSSIPSGVYLGKMWKAITEDGRKFLRWFGVVENRNDICSRNQREILIVESDQ